MRYSDIPRHGDELTTLTAFLEWQRDVLVHKCEGLTDAQLKERSASPSTLSLLGLVRHLADVERWWLPINFEAEDVEPLYSSDTDPDGDFDKLDSVPVAEAMANWRSECERSRDIVARHGLDDTGRNRDTGRTMSMRWVLVHLVEEYSRHDGQADLLRQRIDGAVGYGND